jgi:polysaccharide export outer membrane protein
MKKIFLLLLIPLLIGGCSSYKKSIYLRNDEVLEKAQQNNKQYVYRVMPKDELTITVSTSDPASSVPFYRKIGQGKDQASSAQGMNNAKLLDYLVDNEGNIDYPVLGKLHVAGLTTRECEALIRKELQQYLNEVPNVTVRTSNYKISVLGEVKSPGTYTVSDERINIFQALALAGDMTVFSVRDDVQLLREDSLGNRRVLHLDLTSADIALSPDYYLQQNDIVYVKPTKAKVHSNTFSNNSSTWVSLMSLAATIASLVIVAVQ